MRTTVAAGLYALDANNAKALGGRAGQLRMPTVGAMVAIVEDDVAMRKSIERLLQASGFGTSSFGCGDDFLQSDVATTASALVLDMHLEGMSGLELQRRRLAAGMSCPVIFITAYDDDDTRKQALSLGCTAYLQKPFEAHRLIEALNAACGED